MPKDNYHDNSRWAYYVRGTGKDDVLSDSGSDGTLQEGLGGLTLAGGNGNDIYEVLSADTIIEEKEGQGADEVRTAFDWTLGSWIENLTLTGTGNVAGTGNDLNNLIIGNVGDNELTGGAGSDTLIGGEGIDVAVFDGASSEFEITREGDQVWVTRGVERDLLVGIETMRFTDGDVQVVVDTPDAPANTAPVAGDDSFSGGGVITGSVLGNDSDADGDALTVSAFDQTSASNGTVTMADDGSFTYTAADGFSGTDSFGYTVSDGNGGTDTAVVTVTVAPDTPDTPANTAPVAGNDSFSGSGPISGNVLGNDSDPDGDALTVSAYDPTSASNGTVTMADDGSFTYTAPNGFSGTDRFGYTVSDGNGGTDTAVVTVNVDPVTGEVIQVSSASGLITALNNATGGEVIQLAAGNYGGINLSNRSFDAPVTVRGGTDAVFSSLQLQNSSNMTFEGMTVDYTFSPGTVAVLIHSSNGITLSNMTVDGDLAGDGYPNGDGVRIHYSQNVTVDHTTIDLFRQGMSIHESDSVDILGNTFSHMRSDGMQVVASDDVEVGWNTFRDNIKSPTSGDHPDMLQVHNASGSRPTSNLYIHDNFFNSGDGGWTQTIFMGNEKVNGGAGTEWYYKNIVIEDNVIYNGHAHAITVSAAQGVTVSNNTVLKNPVGFIYDPAIYVGHVSTDVVISNNVIEAGKITHTGSGQVSGNYALSYNSTADNYVGDQFVNPFAGGSATLADLEAQAGSELSALGVGADMTQGIYDDAWF